MSDRKQPCVWQCYSPLAAWRCFNFRSLDLLQKITKRDRRDHLEPMKDGSLLCLLSFVSLFRCGRSLTAAGGIDAGKGQEVDHAKTFRRSVVSGKRRYPIGLHAEEGVRV